MTKKLTWKFPNKEIRFMKIETFTVAILAVFVFFFSLLQFTSYFFAATSTIAFVGIYFLLSYVIQLIRVAEDKYSLTSTHFEIIRKTRFKTKKEKIPLKEIRYHKLDRFFLGGRFFSNKGKHPLFFNTRKELEKFETFLKKNIKLK